MTVERIPLEIRFWSHVDRSGGPDACWPWLLGRDRQGYGNSVKIWDGEKWVQKRAPRVAFFLKHGYWPNVVRHTCDNPPCCNDSHLLDGTHADNAKDRATRGRLSRGERHGMARLTEQQALEIRRRVAEAGLPLMDIRHDRRGRWLGVGALYEQFAMEYGVGTAQISNIVHGRSWRHLVSVPLDASA